MLDIFNIEKQVAKRVKKFLYHKAKESSIPESGARLIINAVMGRVCIHLYAENQYVKTLNLQSIAEYFGNTLNEETERAVYKYMIDLAESEKINVIHLHVMIREHKKELGAYVYHESQYLRKLPLMDILTHFYTKQE